MTGKYLEGFIDVVTSQAIAEELLPKVIATVKNVDAVAFVDDWGVVGDGESTQTLNIIVKADAENGAQRIAEAGVEAIRAMRIPGFIRCEIKGWQKPEEFTEQELDRVTSGLTSSLPRVDSFPFHLHSYV